MTHQAIEYDVKRAKYRNFSGFFAFALSFCIIFLIESHKEEHKEKHEEKYEEKHEEKHEDRLIENYDRELW